MQKTRNGSEVLYNLPKYSEKGKGKGKVTPKQAYVALRDPVC
jgi:hypothetical protein